MLLRLYTYDLTIKTKQTHDNSFSISNDRSSYLLLFVDLDDKLWSPRKHVKKKKQSTKMKNYFNLFATLTVSHL